MFAHVGTISRAREPDSRMLEQKTPFLLSSVWKSEPKPLKTVPVRRFFLKREGLKSKSEGLFIQTHFSRVFYQQRSRKKMFRKKSDFLSSQKYIFKISIWWKSMVWGPDLKTEKVKIQDQNCPESASNLSVGAQTLWSCSTHQFYNFWKFHQKNIDF